MSCKKEGLFDKHHIIPRYMGGSDDFDNLVTFSRTCHTMFHYSNWRLWNNKEDYIAYRGLASQILKEEIIKQTSSIGGKKCYENWIGLFSLTEEEKKKASSKGGKNAGKYMSQSITKIYTMPSVTGNTTDGAGGDWGTNGSNGTTGNGGDAGYYIVNNSNVTWLNNGIRAGNVQ
jgi:hypothetical protein